MDKKKEEMWKNFYYEIVDIYQRNLDGFVVSKKDPNSALTARMCSLAALTELNIVLTEYEDLVFGELPF